MHALALILAATTAASAGPAGAPPEAHPPENLLAGPARCVLRYLEAVRLAGPRPDAMGRLPPAHERDYARARALLAPRTIVEIERGEASGADHPLAPWRDAAHAHVLESFQRRAVRRAPLGAAVVTVTERVWRPPGTDLERGMAEYLVARVDGRWRVVARSAGRPFDDDALRERYTGFFDDPTPSR